MDILKKIELFREGEEKLRWEGTFSEYLQLFRKTKWIIFLKMPL